MRPKGAFGPRPTRSQAPLRAPRPQPGPGPRFRPAGGALLGRFWPVRPTGRCRSSDRIRRLLGDGGGSKPRPAGITGNPSPFTSCSPLSSHLKQRRRPPWLAGEVSSAAAPPPVPTLARALNRVGARHRRVDWRWGTGRALVLRGSRGPARRRPG